MTVDRVIPAIEGGRNRRGLRPMRGAFSALALTLLAAGTCPAPAFAQTSPALIDAMRDADASSEIEDFYADRGWKPLWIRAGRIGPEADSLIQLIETAALDRLDSDDYRPRALAEAVDRATGEGSPRALAKAEMLLSRSFARLARDMRRPRDVGMLYADAELEPKRPSMRTLLDGAAAAPSLRTYLASIGWMNPAYAQLRNAGATYLAARDWREVRESAELALIRLNLDRARALPADPGKRFVLVDAAAARLWMYEDGKVRDTMRVVVGRTTDPTPMMAAMIRYANVNPYWNLPPDLVPSRVAEGVITKGPGFLKTKDFEVLSDWSDSAQVVDPATVDWRAVAEGKVQLRVRQRPGPNNAMGRIKFMFPNDRGIYLHDTPEKALLREDGRLFSAGCVRVENATRLARWLFGRPVPTGKGAAERRVDLPEPVPVYITYLTASVEGSKLVFRNDVYGRDPVRMAGFRAEQVAAR